MALKSDGFDESVDLDVTLNVDPRKPLQAVRGVVSLPHGVGRSVVVAAVSDDPAAQEIGKGGRRGRRRRRGPGGPRRGRVRGV